MKKSQYQKYLCSREWALLKEQVRVRSHGRCERCREGAYESTHHLTYERTGHELLEDLQAVCTGCHKFLSGKSDIDPIKENLTKNAIAAHKALSELSSIMLELQLSSMLCGYDQVTKSNRDSWLWESISDASAPIGRLRSVLEFFIPEEEI